MSNRALVLGRRGTVSELVASVLALGGLSVETGPAAEDMPADLLVLVSPGPADWAVAATFAGGVLLVTERRPGDAEVVEATLAGADAVIHPDASPADLLAAVATVRAGGTLLTPGQARMVARAARSATARNCRSNLALTDREQSILQSAERGESVKQTARSLGIACKTVENLQSRLFRKLGARNRAHAVALAHHFGLLVDSTPATRMAGSL